MRILKTTLMVVLVFAGFATTAQTIMDVDVFRNEFNSLSDKMRVVITSDPGCGGCMYMVQQEMDIFEDPQGCGDNSEIRYFMNWTKVLSVTEMLSATEHTVTWPDPRFIHYWDEFQILGDLYMTTLGLVDPSGTGEYTAWHTVLCYEPGVLWNQNDLHPPVPTFWQHKLSAQYNADQNLYFDETSFAEGFNQLACFTSVVDLSSSGSRVQINKSVGSEGFQFNYRDVVLGSTLMLTSVEGRSVRAYPLNNGTQGLLDVKQRLNPGLYIYSLVENGNIVGSGKFVVTR